MIQRLASDVARGKANRWQCPAIRETGTAGRYLVTLYWRLDAILTHAVISAGPVPRNQFGLPFPSTNQSVLMSLKQRLSGPGEQSCRSADAAAYGFGNSGL
jgi:hypothetical protein